MDKWLLCVVALILGMFMFHMVKSVCGCNTVEGVGGEAEEGQPHTLDEIEKCAALAVKMEETYWEGKINDARISIEGSNEGDTILTKVCGSDYADAKKNCGARCPGGKKYECPGATQCWKDVPCKICGTGSIGGCTQSAEPSSYDPDCSRWGIHGYKWGWRMPSYCNKKKKTN